MKPYTRPATADSEYASGARSNSVAIWYAERDTAPTTITP
jgi:hypothetical protein